MFLGSFWSWRIVRVMFSVVVLGCGFCIFFGDRRIFFDKSFIGFVEIIVRVILFGVGFVYLVVFCFRF